MSIRSRRLSGIAVVDYFASLGMWQPVIGTFGVAAGGGLKALTAANWGPNLVTNGEFTTDTGGWLPSGTTFSRVDAIAEGIGASGGINNWVLKVVKNDAVDFQCCYFSMNTIVGAQYTGSIRAYSPSSNTFVNSACFSAQSTVAWLPGSGVIFTATEDVWQTLVWPTLQTAGDENEPMHIWVWGDTQYDTAYFDSAICYRQGSIALYLGPTQPNGSYVWDIPMPASGVVPRGLVIRYTDSLNYWEVRIKPNTAGNDTDIVEVVVGVETVRATADIDYTASATDKVRVTLLGAVITVEVMKSGTSTWSAATSYATMATGLTQNRIGYMSYGVPGAAEVAKFEVVA